MSRRGKRGGGRKVNRRRRISGIGGLAPARVSEALRSASRCLRRVILPAVAGAAALTGPRRSPVPETHSSGIGGADASRRT